MGKTDLNPKIDISTYVNEAIVAVCVSETLRRIEFSVTQHNFCTQNSLLCGNVENGILNPINNDIHNVTSLFILVHISLSISFQW